MTELFRCFCCTFPFSHGAVGGVSGVCTCGCAAVRLPRTGPGRHRLRSSGSRSFRSPWFTSWRTSWSVVKLLTFCEIRFEADIRISDCNSSCNFQEISVFPHIFRNALRKGNNRAICWVGTFLSVEFKNYVLCWHCRPSSHSYFCFQCSSFWCVLCGHGTWWRCAVLGSPRVFCVSPSGGPMGLPLLITGLETCIFFFN